MYGPYRGPGEGDPIVDEFYIDLDSYPIALGYLGRKVIETRVQRAKDDRSPTGWVIWRRHLVEG